MKTRRRNSSEEDPVTKTGLRNKRSKTVSANETENTDPIPYDLIMEVLSRLPAKSIAKYRYLSKLWASTVLRQDFTELFLESSSSRPQILFACRENHDFVFFSSPQKPDENSSPVVLNRLTRFSFDRSCEISSPVHGLVCLLDDQRTANGRKKNVLVICNPSTGQSLALPKVRTRRVGLKSYLVYDPIDKIFKILSMTWFDKNNTVNTVFGEHQILSLGTENKPSWRMIECSVPHYSSDNGICINGVLYYLASPYKYSYLSMIVRFDVRSEKFRSITIVEGLFRKVGRGDLINYNGKLGLIVTQHSGCVDVRFQESVRSIELWVLEDDEKQEWSKNTYVYVFPALCHTVGAINLRFLGMTQTNEVVFSFGAEYIGNHLAYCIFYYSLERNTIVKVGFQGMEANRNEFVGIFLNHVENVKSLCKSFSYEGIA